MFPRIFSRYKYKGTEEEKQSLISDSFSSTSSTDIENKVQQFHKDDIIGCNKSDNMTKIRPTSAGTRSRQSSTSRDVMERIFQLSQSGAHSVMEEELNNVTLKPRGQEDGRGFVELSGDQVVDQGLFETVQRFFRQQKKRLILCTGSFFSYGALFAFNVYSVNFVTTSICGGDANAPPGSEKYENYLRGIKIGSTGLLVFYISFAIGTTLQDVLLRKVGWWTETSVVICLYVVGNMVCAIAKHEWAYYSSSFICGIYRATMFSVPYILVCRLLTNNEETDQSKGDDSKSENNGDIALVAAMLPLSMVVCAVVIGPLIELTGDAATPIYFSGVSAFLGSGMFFLLRKY